MKLYKALQTFDGDISMRAGEARYLNDTDAAELVENGSIVEYEGNDVPGLAARTANAEEAIASSTAFCDEFDSMYTAPEWNFIYVSSVNGDDANDGRRETTPIATLNKAFEILNSDKPSGTVMMYLMDGGSYATDAKIVSNMQLHIMTYGASATGTRIKFQKSKLHVYNTYIHLSGTANNILDVECGFFHFDQASLYTEYCNYVFDDVNTGMDVFSGTIHVINSTVTVEETATNTYGFVGSNGGTVVFTNSVIDVKAKSLVRGFKDGAVHIEGSTITSSTDKVLIDMYLDNLTINTSTITIDKASSLNSIRLFLGDCTIGNTVFNLNYAQNGTKTLFVCSGSTVKVWGSSSAFNATNAQSELFQVTSGLLICDYRVKYSDKINAVSRGVSYAYLHASDNRSVDLSAI